MKVLRDDISIPERTPKNEWNNCSSHEKILKSLEGHDLEFDMVLSNSSRLAIFSKTRSFAFDLFTRSSIKLAIELLNSYIQYLAKTTVTF